MQNTTRIILFLMIIVFIQYSAIAQLDEHDLFPMHIEPGVNENVTPTSDRALDTPKPQNIDIIDSVSKPSESKFIEDYVKNLETGGMRYNPPKEMTIDISEPINATIIKGNTSGEPIKVAPYMEIYLNGSAFEIIPITQSRQFIAGDSPTIWKWYVIPRKLDNQTLDLLAYVVIKMPDGREEKRALVKSKTIHIHVNPLDEPGISDIMLALFEGPWAKVIGALSGLLAFIAIFFKDDILAWIRSRRRSPKE